MNKEFSNIKAIIFDMDGVLVDTQKFFLQAWKPFAEKKGFEIDLLAWNAFWGTGFKRKVKMLQEKGMNITEEEFIKEIILTARKFQNSQLKQNNELTNLFKYLSKKYLLAVASSNNRSQVELVLNKLELTKFLKTILTANEVKETKPNPQIYSDTAKKLGINPENCLVIEDALPGLEAAHSAEMKCVLLKTWVNKNYDVSKADGVIENLKELKKII